MNIVLRRFLHIRLQTVQMPGVCSVGTVYGTVQYKEPLKSFVVYNSDK